MRQGGSAIRCPPFSRGCRPERDLVKYLYLADLGVVSVDDWHGNGGPEEFRTLQALARDARYHEALERASAALTAGNLGRKQAGRIHSLLCWLYVEGMHQSCPAAALHGEEAARLAELIGEPWAECEALCRLVHVYCHLGDITRAKQACDKIADEVEYNPGTLDGGMATVWTLRAVIAAASGDEEGALTALEQAEREAAGGNADIMARIRSRKVTALLSCGRRAQALQVVAQAPTEGPADGLDWAVATAWVTLEASGPAQARPLIEAVMDRAQSSGNLSAEAHCLALQALAEEQRSTQAARRVALQAVSRAMTAGRVDLVHQFRRRFQALL